MTQLRNVIFWLFRTKQDQMLPSNVHGNIWPNSTQFWLRIMDPWFYQQLFFRDNLYFKSFWVPINHLEQWGAWGEVQSEGSLHCWPNNPGTTISISTRIFMLREFRHVWYSFTVCVWPLLQLVDLFHRWQLCRSPLPISIPHLVFRTLSPSLSFFFFVNWIF